MNNIYIIYTKDEQLIQQIFDDIEISTTVRPTLYDVSLINLNGHSDISKIVTAFELPDTITFYAKNIITTYKINARKLNGNNFIEPVIISEIETITKAKSNVKTQITSKVEELKYIPIVYDGKNLDADVTAQTNISGKIAQIQNEIALSVPSTDLVWKDADNVVHTWINVNAYLEWLQGLQIAIANRTTALYQTAWTGKSAVDALTTVQEVIDYDINALFGI